ncbi:MAG TPA: diphthamide biosynthesis enzyme Dph2 [Candidatus Thermoplasmatota archaeon]|nr:diphthamide biosynthesis enzyme Dph2 [Candidatus Thermoplasmatota archaeon]
MQLMGYELDLDTVLDEIKGKGYKVIGLQFPDGLRDFYGPVCDAVEKATGASTVVSADPSYGACDLSDDEMEKIKVDALIHFGHTRMPHLARFERIPIYFVRAESLHDIRPAVEAAIPLLPGKRIGVIATTQHLHKIDHALEILRRHGFDPRVQGGDTRISAPGQVVGCNYSAADKDADAYLYIGSGVFHPLGLALNTDKPIICADPYNNEVRTMEDERHRFLKQRYGQVAAARDAKTFGVLASSKQGQLRWNMAKALKTRIEKRGRKAYLILLRQFAPEYLVNFRHLDAFVSTACPRVAIDDYGRYPKPMLTPVELEMVLGDRPLDQYRLDEIHGSSI